LLGDKTEEKRIKNKSKKREKTPEEKDAII
jgi:hypothetical protein